MALFRPYERTVRSESESGSTRRRLTPRSDEVPEPSIEQPPVSELTNTPRGPRRKEGATRSRAQAEAARMERLHPNLSPKEQRKADRQARMQQRVEAWDKVEASKERRLARDWVDTRWSVTEFMLPAMLVVMAAVMVTLPWPQLSTYIGLLLWVLMFAAIINHFITWRSFKAELHRRWPNSSTRGLGMYMFNRALMIRRFRRPTPEIDRGDTPR